MCATPTFLGRPPPPPPPGLPPPKVRNTPSPILCCSQACVSSMQKSFLQLQTCPLQVYGPESSGKTTLALHAMAAVQRAGGTALLVDAEHAFDPQYSKARLTLLLHSVQTIVTQSKARWPPSIEGLHHRNEWIYPFNTFVQQLHLALALLDFILYLGNLRGSYEDRLTDSTNCAYCIQWVWLQLAAWSSRLHLRPQQLYHNLHQETLLLLFPLLAASPLASSETPPPCLAPHPPSSAPSQPCSPP